MYILARTRLEVASSLLRYAENGRTVEFAEGRSCSEGN